MSRTANRRPATPACFTCPFHQLDAASSRASGRPGLGPGMAIEEGGAFAGVYGDGLCKRFPEPVAKGPHDWCGEHPDFRAKAL